MCSDWGPEREPGKGATMTEEARELIADDEKELKALKNLGIGGFENHYRCCRVRFAINGEVLCENFRYDPVWDLTRFKKILVNMYDSHTLHSRFNVVRGVRMLHAKRI